MGGPHGVNVAAALGARFYTNPHLLGLAVVLLLVAGASALVNLPRLEDPRITTRNATVLTRLPGASASRVEALVTKPIEDRLEEVEEIKTIESTSREGLSRIAIELADHVGPETNEAIFAEIRAKLRDAEPGLPAGAGRPELDDERGAVAFSLILGLRAAGGAGEEPPVGVLSRLSELLGDRLRNLAGTELVRVYGAVDEEFTVTFDPAELAELGLTAGDVARRVRASDAKTPAGVVRTPARSLPVEVGGELDSLARLRAVPLAATDAGAVVRLGDVAAVERGWTEPPRAVALAEGRRAVLVAARTESGVRVDRWAERARAAVRGFAAEVGPGVDVVTVFDQSRYTGRRLGRLGANLLAGGALVVLVVWVAMGWRSALIVGAALPLSAAAAGFGLSVLGQPIHQMTIFGLIIAIGLLIDNAIVVTDEVSRRLGQRRSRAEALAAALRHLGVPLGASTLTTVLGFMPILLLPGNVGDFVGPIAASVVLALVASFAISMTVIAALAARFAPARADGRGARRRRWWRAGLATPALERRYRAALGWAVARPLPAIALALVLPALGLGLAADLPQQFFPSADRDQLEVELILPSDAAIGRTRAVAETVDRLVRERAGVRSADWLVGGSFPSVYYNLVMTEDDRPDYAHGIVRAESPQAASRLVVELQAALTERLPAARVVVQPFGQGPPFAAPVAFRVTGPDVATLRALGEAVRRAMHEDPAITVSAATIGGGARKLWFVPDKDEAELAGLTPRALADQLQASLEGGIGATVLEDLESLPVRIRFPAARRGSLEAVSTLSFVVPASGGAPRWLPASALGRLELRPTPASVTRRDGERVNTVLGFVRPGALPIEVAERVAGRLDAAGFDLPPGYRLEVAGETEEQGEAVRSLATYVPVLVVLMAATLVLSFRSVALAALVAAVAVLALGLGLLALRVSGHALGFNPILGSLGLVGVAINGAIVVLAAIRADPAARAGQPAAIVEETVGATRHIVATTLTTVGGFVPLLLAGGTFWPPLAVVIAGGVGLSIVLSLGLTPAVYALLARRASGAGRGWRAGDARVRALPAT